LGPFGSARFFFFFFLGVYNTLFSEVMLLSASF